MPFAAGPAEMAWLPKTGHLTAGTIASHEADTVEPPKNRPGVHRLQRAVGNRQEWAAQDSNL